MQADALLQLPAAISNWDAATAAVPGAPWVNGTNPCGGGGAAAWKGVSCRGDNVTALDLPGLGLQGTLPQGLEDLLLLQRLNLSSNAFTGPVPPSWLEPPTLPTLDVCDLSNNRLTGGAGGAGRGQEAGGAAPALVVGTAAEQPRVCRRCRPRATGGVQRELGLLARQSVYLGNNTLRGQLPSTLANPQLLVLDLHDNQLTGLLPAGWGDRTALPWLEKLDLSRNMLRGAGLEPRPHVHACTRASSLRRPAPCAAGGRLTAAPPRLAAFAGPIPDPQWTATGFYSPCEFEARPGNAGQDSAEEPGLCGERAALPQRAGAAGAACGQPALPPQGAALTLYSAAVPCLAALAGQLLGLDPRLYDPSYLLNPSMVGPPVELWGCAAWTSWDWGGASPAAPLAPAHDHVTPARVPPLPPGRTL